MITAALKSHFYIIVALASIVGSVIAAPHISNFADVASSDPSILTPTASAQSLPHQVDHHVKIKEKTGDRVRVEESVNDADRHCEMSCTYAAFTPGKNGKAGLAYISDSPMDLSGARRVHFFLMGDKGGEMVKVYFAGKNPSSGQKADSLFKEKFARLTDVITLTNDWQRYEISLAGVNLTSITTPFAIELLKSNKTSATQAVYFKFITYENQAVDPRFLLPTTAEALVAAPLSTEISGNATSGEAPMTIEFGSNTTGGIEPYVDPRWEFGDDEEGEGANVSHTYSEPGEYNVTFTVDDSGNQTASDSLIVQVTEPEAEPEQQQEQEEEEVPTDGENVTGNDEDSDSSNDESDDSSSSDDCDSSYPDVCIPPPPPVLDCSDIDEEDFEVQGSDPHGFDDDNDGVGCEAEDSSSSSDSSDDDSSSTTVSDTDNGVQQMQQSETPQEGNSTLEEGNESP